MFFRILGLFIAMLSWNAAAETTPIVPVAYSTSVDLSDKTATFNVTLDRTPDFFSTNEYGRQADLLQFWVDAKYKDPIRSTYDALENIRPADTQSLISFGEIPTLHQLEVVWIAPLDDTAPKSSGGWGPVVGHVPYTLDQENLSFTVPLSLLRSSDGTFYYEFETFAYAAATGPQVYWGKSGLSYSGSMIPEPSVTWLLLTGGLLMLLLSRRLRHSEVDTRLWLWPRNAIPAG